MGLVTFMDNCPPIDGVVVSWTIAHEIKYFSLFMDNLKIWWTIAKFLKGNFTYIPEDPAFSTGGRPIFKCKYLCIGLTYSRN